MIYKIKNEKISQSERAVINEKIIDAVVHGKHDMPKEAIYNLYTGIGGLHELKQEDFKNYHEFSEAKKEIEKGQFFTPKEVARLMVEMASPDHSDSVMDMCCGSYPI